MASSKAISTHVDGFGKFGRNSQYSVCLSLHLQPLHSQKSAVRQTTQATFSTTEIMLFRSRAAAFGLFFTSDRLAPTCGSTVTVTELNEDPGCEGRTTAMYATITPGSCADNGKYDVCTTENGWGLLSSEYTFCEFDQAAYLRYAFNTSFYVLVEFYWDVPCENLWSTVVLLADGKCHNSVQEIVLVTADEDTLYLQSRGLSCESGIWGNITDPVPMAMVNSGKCFVGDDSSTKVYLVDGTAAASPSALNSTSVVSAFAAIY